MGKKRWDGTQVDSGYSTLIGNKEIEVDSQISKSEMPVLNGTSAEYENDLEFGSPAQTQTPGSAASPLIIRAEKPRLEKKASTASFNATPTPAKRYVAPASFYAQAPKPKPMGPLYVVTVSRCSPSSDVISPDMIQPPRARS